MSSFLDFGCFDASYVLTKAEEEAKVRSDDPHYNQLHYQFPNTGCVNFATFRGFSRTLSWLQSFLPLRVTLYRDTKKSYVNSWTRNEDLSPDQCTVTITKATYGDGGLYVTIEEFRTEFYSMCMMANSRDEPAHMSNMLYRDMDAEGYTDGLIFWTDIIAAAKRARQKQIRAMIFATTHRTHVTRGGLFERQLYRVIRDFM